jgi:hypothetical protein
VDVSSWLVHVCTKKSRVGLGVKGDPAFGAASTFRARVEKKRSTVRSADGRETVTSHVLVTTTPINPDDVVWFPSIAGEAADDTTTIDAGRTPLAVEVATTKGGAGHLWQVYF